METSPFELRLPDGTGDEEAAVISAAIDAYLAAEAEDEPPDRPSWSDRGWWFAARIESLQGRSVVVPRDAPRDPWRAASRTDRY